MANHPSIVATPRPVVAALVFCAALLAAAQPARATNLVVNGDFEACAVALAPAGGSLSSCGWLFGDNAGVNAGIGNPGKGVRLESNGLATRDPTMAQTLSGLSVGTSYRLTWDLDLRSISGGTNADPSFGVFLDNQSFGSSLFLLATPVDGYLPYAVEFVATAASHTLIFAGELDARSNGVAGSDTDVGYNIDNICLDVTGGTCGGVAAAVPEPGALLLLAAMPFALAPAIRRRRRG